MNVTTIPLGGVTRNTSDQQAVDGEMAALINLRPKDGSLNPMRQPIRVATCANTGDIVYVHTNASYQNWIGYDGSSLLHVRRIVEGEEAEDMSDSIMEIDNLVEVKSIGNTLIVIHATGIEYAIYQDEAYRLIGDLHLPIVLKSHLHLFSTDTDYSVTCDAMSITAIENNDDVLTDDMKTHANGLLYQLMDEATQDGLLHQPLLVRYAFRLFDGSHIHHSSPELAMGTSTHYTEFITSSTTSSGSNAVYTFTYSPHKLYTSIESSSTFDASLYSDIITHIDLFIAPITVLEPEQEYTVTYKNTELPYVDSLTYKSLDDIIEDISTTSTFYKVASWAIDDLSTGYVDLEDTLSLIEHQDTLDLDDLSHHTLTGQASYVYNSKLHLGNISTSLYEGHSLQHLSVDNSSFNGESTGVSDPLYGTYPLGTLKGFIYTTLSTSSGTSVVVNEFLCVDIYGINPLISYPDPRATQMDIYIYSDGGLYNIYRFPLTASTVLNIAYYIDPNLLAIIPTYQTDTSSSTPSLSDAKNSVEHTPNKMRVSELDNPFIFPVEQTYTISNSAIVGMASATQTLSQGQFGQHPLYVFTKEGIWSMSVGDGNIAYATSLPIGREVCVNNKSITPVDNAVIFVSSRGIHYISGSDVNVLTHAIDGKPLQYSWLLNSMLSGVFNIDKHPPLISEIAANCQLGYNYIDNEVWVHVDNTMLTWVYSLTYNTWSLVYDDIDQFISCYPTLYYKRSTHIYEVGSRESTDFVDAMFVTRPLKLGSLGYKKIDALYTRVSALFNSIQLFLYGSNDLTNYTLIGKAVNEQDYNTIQMHASHHPFRYFVVGCSCSMDVHSTLDQIDITFRNAYNNKLR